MQTVAQRRSNHRAVALAAPRRSLRAVCIDDDSDFLSLLVQQLEDLGLAAIGASNAILGIRTIQREQPDLVVVDYHMPNAHGTYVLRRMQEDETLSAVPMIVVTGRDVLSRVDPGHTLEQQLRRLGARSVLRKPLNVHSLIAAVHKCLNPLPPAG
jgi:CheY-like chemotaxis protein